MIDLDDLRYPIGKFSAPASSMAGMRAANIRTLRQLPEKLRAAVADLTDAQLDTPYREEGWTPRQVVHHLADSHMHGYMRIKRALTEEWPEVKIFNEAAWAELADSRWLPIDGSLALIDALHCRWAGLMESLTEEDFRRGYVHPDLGRVNLAKALALYDWHSRHHTAHITALRTRMGW
jgi:uncharacterized damage-inducible protein DinB